MDEESSDLAEPLLQEDQQEENGSHSMSNAVFNLSKVIIGAGMMAIPRAYYQVGSILGTAMLVGVGALTHYTLAALVRGSSMTGAKTYSQLALVTCGWPTMKLLQLAVLSFCFGFGVVYLVVIRDILLGTPPDCNGLLCELLGLSPSSTLANPQLVITAVALLVLAPLLLLRSMDKLATLNVIGVTSIALLAAAAAGLAVQGCITGAAYPLPSLPQWQLLGPTRGQQLEALTAVVPVLIACYVAHQSLHPLMPSVKPYSDGKMRRVITLALLISFAVYFTLAVGSALSFGPTVQVNVLNNFSVAGLEPLMGSVPAKLLSWSIRGGYLVSLLASLLLYMHPLRSCLAEMIWQQGASLQTLDNHSQIDVNHVSPQLTVVNQATTVATAANRSAAKCSNGAESSSNDRHNNGPFAAVVPPAAAAAQIQHDPNPLDDSRVLVAFDSMDQPAFGSWKPGFKFFGLGSKHDSLNPSLSVNAVVAAARGRTQAKVGRGTAAATAAVMNSANGTVVTAAADVEVQSRGLPAPPPPQRQQQHSWQKQEQQWYYVLTYSLLIAMVLVAVLASNIWIVLSAIGDLASTIQAFVVPGLIAVVLAVCSTASGLLLPQQQQQQQLHNNALPVQAAANMYSSAESSSTASTLKQASWWCGGQYRMLLKSQCRGADADALLQRMLHAVMGGFVVALGLALFANGILQRI